MNTNDMTLESFIDAILDEKSFRDLEPEVRAELKEDLMGRAEDQINAALLAELSEGELKEFEDLVDDESDGKTLQEYLSKHVKDMEQVVAATLIRFRSSYLGSM